MKYFYSLLFSILFFSSDASHLMGGDITIIELPNGEHLVSLIAYRDTVGIPMTNAANFEFTGPNGYSFSLSTPYDSVISGTVLPMYPYGVEVYFFSDTVNFPIPGEWHVSWQNCCRNGAIQNLSAPLSEMMYLSTNIEISSMSSNSSPFFLVPAAIYLPLNTPWQYNPLPFDPDGDSLVWSLDFPLNDSASQCVGYTTPPSAANNPLTLDSATGTISWTANTVGHFVISVLVEQYRNGVWLGEIRRDMQLIVVPASHGYPYWTAFNGQAPSDTIVIDIPANSPLSFDIVASHSDSSQALYMDAFSPLLLDGASNANFSTSPTGNHNDIMGNFSFTPDTTHTGKEYIVVVRCSDKYFTNDQAVTIRVSSAIGLNELASTDKFGNWQLYPNPADQDFYLSFLSKETDILNIEVLDLEGRVIRSRKAEAQLGANVLQMDDLRLQSGVYILRVNSKNGSVWTSKLIKQ